MHDRRFRFGIQASGPMTSTDWADFARRCEDLGYSTLTAADHLREQFAPIPALVAAADATTSLRVGALVLCNDYRHPVIAAKEAATVDLLSDGRFELGLGAGWMTTDYEQSGIPLDPPAVRIARLAESIEIVTGLFGPDPVDFEGTHYRVTGLVGTPEPVQTGGPPLVIGGGGRSVLSLAARHADIVGINPSLRSGVIGADTGPSGTATVTDTKLGWIRDAAGDRFDDLELQVRIHLAMIDDSREQVADSVAPSLGLTPTEAMESPHALVGTVEQICDQLIERRERWGISYIGLSADCVDSFAPVVARLAGN